MKKKIMNLFFCLNLVFLLSIESVNAAGVTSYVTCGPTAIPSEMASIVRTVFLLLQFCVPIGIIVMGSLDFVKAVSASDADKIKKSQKRFVSRLITGALVFFVFVVVKLVINIADNSSSDFSNCLNCLINTGDGCNTVTESPFQPDAD